MINPHIRSKEETCTETQIPAKANRAGCLRNHGADADDGLPAWRKTNRLHRCTRRKSTLPHPGASGRRKTHSRSDGDALNLYYSKGVANSRNSIVIQPSVTVGYKDFSINLWGNLDTNPYR